MYFVGLNGSIVHYDGVNFVQMASGTDVDLRDVFGGYNTVLTTGHSNGNESITLQYNGTEWIQKFYSETLLPGEGSNFLGRMYSVWVHLDTLYIVAKAGLWKESLSGKEGILLSPVKTNMVDRVIKRIRGNGYNDILFSDIWGEMIHYNGSTWYLDQTIYNQYPNGELIIRSMDYMDNLCIAVGYLGAKAFVIRGQRND
jgi:hypothetical protein